MNAQASPPRERNQLSTRNLLHALSESMNDIRSLDHSVQIPEIRQTKPETSSANLIDKFSDLTQDFLEKTLLPSPLPDYDPYRCPPNINKCIQHLKAHKVSAKQVGNINGDACEATGIKLNHKELSLWCSLSDLFHLGPVIPMYFHFIKQIMVILFGLAAVPIALSIIQNEFVILDYENFINKSLNEAIPSLIIVLEPFIFSIFLFFILYWFRRSLKSVKLSCKKNVITPSDYTIMCTNMGSSQTEEEVKKFFGKMVLSGFNLDILKVVLTYNIKDYTEKVRKLQNFLKQREQLIKSQDYVNQRVIDRLDFQIQDIYNYFVLSKQKQNQGFKLNGVCFVSFSIKNEAKAVRRKFDLSLFEKLAFSLTHKCVDGFPENHFKENFINVTKAPELYEIIWENLNHNKTDRLAFILRILVSILPIGITFLALMFIKTTDFSFQSYAIGLVIALVNEVLKLVVLWLAPYEKYRTITQLQIGIAYRLSILQIINMSAPILILDGIVFQNNIAQLALDALIISAFCFFMPLIVRVINFPYLMKKIKRNKIISLGENCRLTQEQANLVFEEPEFKVWLLYPDIIKILLFTCLFSAISPFISILAIIALLITYWLDKYNLLRRSLLPSNMRSELAEAVFEFVDVTVAFIFGGLHIYFFFFIAESSNSNLVSDFSSTLPVETFALVVACIYALLPHKRFSRGCSPNTSSADPTAHILYHHAAEHFYNDYQAVNPIRSEQRTKPDLKDTYSEIFNEIGKQKVLVDFPTCLPVFYYAIKRPALHKIWTSQYQGLQNPYYFFPQNYEYGFQQTGTVQKRVSTSYKGPIRRKEKRDGDSVEIRFEPESEPRGVFDAGRELLSIEKKDARESGPKTNSVMSDLKLLPSVNEKNEEESKGIEDLQRIRLSENGRLSKGSWQQSYSQLNYSVSPPYEITSISPILSQGTITQRNSTVAKQ